jgi:hypothetical protein
MLKNVKYLIKKRGSAFKQYRVNINFKFKRKPFGKLNNQFEKSFTIFD